MQSQETEMLRMPRRYPAELAVRKSNHRRSTMPCIDERAFASSSGNVEPHFETDRDGIQLSSMAVGHKQMSHRHHHTLHSRLRERNSSWMCRAAARDTPRLVRGDDWARMCAHAVLAR